MVSTFTPNKNIEQPAHNDFVNTWDVPVNADWSQIDKAFGNSVNKNATGLSGNVTLAVADYVPLTIIISGLPTAAITYRVPAGVGGQWVFANATTGGFNVGISSVAGGTTIVVPAGQNTLVSCDGSATGMRLSVTTTPVAAGSNTQVQFNSGGLLGASAGMTWDGTTLATTGLNTSGATVLGDAAGDTTTINGTAIATPNGINIDTNTLVVDATNNRVGVGTNTPGSTLTAAGTIESTSGGYKFPDATVQTSASVWRLFQAQTVAGVPFIDFTGIPTTVSNVMVEFELLPATNGVDLALQCYGTGGVLDTGTNYDYATSACTSVPSSGIFGATSAIFIPLNRGGNSISNNIAVGISGLINFQNIQATRFTKCTLQSTYLDSSGSTLVAVTGGGWHRAAANITGYRLVFSGGNIASGKVSTYVST